MYMYIACVTFCGYIICVMRCIICICHLSFNSWYNANKNKHWKFSNLIFIDIWRCKISLLLLNYLFKGWTKVFLNMDTMYSHSAEVIFIFFLLNCYLNSKLDVTSYYVTFGALSISETVEYFFCTFCWSLLCIILDQEQSKKMIVSQKFARVDPFKCDPVETSF